MSSNQLTLQNRAYPRVGRVRVNRSYRTSIDLTRCQFESATMQTVSYNQFGPWNRTTRELKAVTPVPNWKGNSDASVEWEFSEAMRSPRFPAGWFVLPAAVLPCLLLLSILH